jgi:putative DNA primase/helicase
MIRAGKPRVADAICAAEEVAPRPIDLKETGLTQRDALLQICDTAEVWRSPEGEAFASVPVRGHVEHHAMTSRAFRNWMLRGLATGFTVGGRPASANDNTIRDARNAVEARAMVEGTMYPAPLRVTQHEGAIYLDLGTDDWSVARVTEDGWSIIPQAPVPILRGKRAGPFALPAPRGDFGPLRRLLVQLDDDAFIMFVAWCLGAMLPNGPFPILVLGGEQGSGKSTLARTAQRIVDPGHGDLLQPPGDDRDLIAAARCNRVLSFDNLSSVRAELADSLCRLATGSEIGGRALYSDHDTASFAACRPMVLNGIPDLAARGDLADRAIVLRLGTLPGRMTEKDWRVALEAVLPATLAALLDALSLGLRDLDRTRTPNLRMADFARFVLAAEPALPWPPGAFIAAYERCRLDATAALADGESVVNAVRRFMGDSGPGWQGLMSDLYRSLSRTIGREALRPDDWPGNARWFGDRLRRSAPVLRTLGIDFRERRGAAGTKVTLSRLAPLATPGSGEATPASLVQHGANGAGVPTKPLSHANGGLAAPGCRTIAHDTDGIAELGSAALASRSAGSSEPGGQTLINAMSGKDSQ